MQPSKKRSTNLPPAPPATASRRPLRAPASGDEPAAPLPRPSSVHASSAQVLPPAPLPRSRPSAHEPLSAWGDDVGAPRVERYGEPPAAYEGAAAQHPTTKPPPPRAPVPYDDDEGATMVFRADELSRPKLATPIVEPPFAQSMPARRATLMQANAAFEHDLQARVQIAGDTPGQASGSIQAAIAQESTVLAVGAGMRALPPQHPAHELQVQYEVQAMMRHSGGHPSLGATPVPTPMAGGALAPAPLPSVHALEPRPSVPAHVDWATGSVHAPAPAAASRPRATWVAACVVSLAVVAVAGVWLLRGDGAAESASALAAPPSAERELASLPEPASSVAAAPPVAALPPEPVAAPEPPVQAAPEPAEPAIAAASPEAAPEPVAQAEAARPAPAAKSSPARSSGSSARASGTSSAPKPTASSASSSKSGTQGSVPKPTPNSAGSSKGSSVASKSEPKPKGGNANASSEERKAADAARALAQKQLEQSL